MDLKLDSVPKLIFHLSPVLLHQMKVGSSINQTAMSKCEACWRAAVACEANVTCDDCEFLVMGETQQIPL